jgi:hypothetical protein
MLAVWQAADEIEVYESGWTFDHFYPIFSDSDGPCLEGWTTLTSNIHPTRRFGGARRATAGRAAKRGPTAESAHALPVGLSVAGLMLGK